MEGPRELDPGPAGIPPWVEGGLIARRYTLERKLGSGSTGVVWLAEDGLLKKRVALKVLRHNLAKKRDTVHRFLREVALAHAVTHPHVVRIYDTGEEEGLPFFTMEHLKGQTLEERIDAGERAMDFKEIRRIALHVLDGLDAAHEVGVVHRDLKPSNVMLTHRGAIVMDFGVAGISDAPLGKPQADSVQALVRTEAGTIFGSPAYMAPELWEGSGASVQSDLFAYGVMLYQMTTGRLPFQAKTPAGYLQQLTTGRPPGIRTLRRDTPWPLLRVVGRCMSPAPAQRPVSAIAATTLLSPLRTGRRRAIAAGLLGVAAVGGLAVWGRAPWEMRARGVPSMAASDDLSAAVDVFDAGDEQASLRMLGRLSARAPRSAAVTFWRAVVHHELGDEQGRHASCRIIQDAPQPLLGSESWRQLAQHACGDVFALPPVDPTTLRELDAPHAALLPLRIDSELLPQVELEGDAEGPAHTRARELLRALADGSVGSKGLPHRMKRAQVDLELALGRMDEAQRHIKDLAEASPHIPLFTVHAAWLAGRRGNDERARALAQSVFHLAPAAEVAQDLQAGRLRSAWRRIESTGDHPGRPQLQALWCGMAWRHGVRSPPPQCSDLRPGLVSALWGATDAAPRDVREADLWSRERALENEECPAPSGAQPVLTHAPAGFELLRAEQNVRASLCRADCGDPDALTHAREQTSRLLAAAPKDPWVLLLAAHVDEASDAPAEANAHRLEAAQRWRDADGDLPRIAALRSALDTAPRGPRSAAQQAPEN